MKLSQFTIKQYYDYVDVFEDDGLDLIVKKAKFMLNCAYKETLSLDIRKLYEYAIQFDLIENDLSDLIPSGYIKVSDRVFKCVYEAEKMIAGQYIDFSAMRERTQGNPKNIHALLAVMCYEGKEYDGTKNAEKEELFLNEALMGDVYPYAFFLSARLKVLNEIILPYFVREYPKWRMKEMMTSGKGGGGLYYWNAFVAFIGRTWTRLHALVSLSFLIGGRILKNAMTGIKRRLLNSKGQ